jgi:DNA-binding SARP family transcriptional activator/predicted negative regulator of RcsB-dependent stress response
VKFKILGPLEITFGTDRLELRGTRQHVVVATLLLNVNRVVRMDRLLEAIYGEDLPPTCRSQAQISISSVRRQFAACGSPEIIATHEHGYVIGVDSGDLDSAQFEKLVAEARGAHRADNAHRAIALYRDALRLWRGPALDGIESQFVRAASSRLDELRIATNEGCLELELDAGRHNELISELTDLVHQYPLREALRGHLILALYRCGRVAEALAAYRQARQTMIDELGIEPSERLQQLQRAILSSDPGLDLPTEPVWVQAVNRRIPNLLPTDIADFTGRAEQVGLIRQHLAGMPGAGKRAAVPVVVIVGKGGVGKTSTAIHASHSLAGDFPDGTLYADLHGGASHPVDALQVLERFLRALGVPVSQIPDGLDEQAEMYRDLLADRKILIVLDDAVGESQVSPLLPGSGESAVLVTSRNWLAGLAGAVRVDLHVFDADKSLDLLTHIVGATRVQTQLTAAAAVAGHCGHLPLALRIAGTRLSARPHWSIQQLADRLADETRRLDELSHGDMGIRPSISVSYESASKPARQLFRRLALLDVPVFSGWLSAVLLDRQIAESEDLLDELIAAQLVESACSGPGVWSQYRFHDLIRMFARERLADEESAADRKAALERALAALLYLSDAARRRYYGGDYVRLHSDAQRWPLPESLATQLVSDPLLWYDRERAALISGVRQAARAGFAELCWSLAFSAVTLFESRIYLDDWQETHDIALEATRKANHVRGQAAMLYSMGSLHMSQQRFGPARKEFITAAKLFSDVDDDQGIALVTRHIAYMDRLSGRLDDATIRYEQALATFRATGDHVAAAYVLQNLAQVKLEQREFGKAMELLSDALRLSRIAQCTRAEAQALHRTGEAYLLAGDPGRAVDTFELALARIREIGDPVGEAHVLQGAGLARVRQGELDKARSTLQRALQIAHTLGERLVEARALLALGELALVSGAPGNAVVSGRRAAGAFHDMGVSLHEAQALSLLSHAYAALGDGDTAAEYSARAAALRTKLDQDDQAGSALRAR